MCSQPTSEIPEYFHLLPSEVCRLILGYLRHNGHHNAACSLFSESNELAELRTQYSRLSDLPMHLTQITLLDLIQDYLRVANAVAHQLSRVNVTCKLGNIGPLLPQLLKSNLNGVMRVPSIRPMRVAWLPAGKSYLPPRVVTPERMNTAQNNLRLPLVAVRPHLYSAASVLSPKLTPVLSVSSTSSSGIVSVSSASSAFPLIATAPGGRPLIRLVRHSTPTGGPPTSGYHHDQSGGVCNSVDSGLNSIKSAALIPPTPQCSSPTNTTDLTPVIARTWSSHTKVVPENPPLDDKDSVSSQSHLPNDNQEPEVIDSKRLDPVMFPSGELHTEVNDPPVLEQCTVSSPEASSPLPPPNDTTVSISSPACPSASVTQDPPTPGTTDTSCSTFTVIKHLPPQSETKRLSRDSDSCAHEEQQPSVQSGQSRRRRSQMPRHMLSGQTNAAEVASGTESQEDVDFQRFLSALFSKPEHLATHINTKLSNKSRSSNAASFGESHATASDRLVCGSGTATDANANEDHLRPGSDPVEPVTNSPMRTSTESIDETAVVNPIFDWLEDDLESCIDQLLSQFDPSKPESDQPITEQDNHLDQDRCQSPQVNRSSIVTPVEVIDLILPSGASTPAYSRCSSVRTTASTTDTTTSTVATVTAAANVAPAVVASVSTMSHDRHPTSRPSCSPPLCLSQLARSIDSPHKRRRLNTDIAKGGHRSSGHCTTTTTTTTLLQTPDFKGIDPGEIVHTELPRHDLFTDPSQTDVYEDYIDIRTLYDSRSIGHNSEFNPPQFVSQSCYLDTVPLDESTHHSPVSWQRAKATPDSVRTTSPMAQLSPTGSVRSSLHTDPNPLSYQDSTYGIYSTVNHSTVLSSTATYHGLMTAEPTMVPHHSHPDTLVPATPEPVHHSPHEVNHIHSHVPARSNDRLVSVAVSPASAQTPVSLLTSMHQSRADENAQPFVINSSSFASMQSQSRTSWSESVILLPDGLNTMPVVPLNQVTDFSSGSNFVFYQPAVTSTTTVNSPSTADTRTLQPIQFNVASLNPGEFVQTASSSSGSNPVLFQMPKDYLGGPVPWNVSAGSTLVIPVNVDLDSPNSHRLTPTSQASLLSCLPNHPSAFENTNSQPETLVSRSAAVHRSPRSATDNPTSSVDKENQRPLLIVQKNARRKILNLGSIDVDQILSKSHCE